jgi:hypothetical protein
MKSPNPDQSYDEVSPIILEGETMHERILLSLIKVLVAGGCVTENEVKRAWEFVSK